MQYKINKWDCIIEPILKNNIQIGGLYIGDIDCAQSADLMRKLQIGALLSVIDEPEFDVPLGVIHERISIPDSTELNLTEYFPRTYDFIERHRTHSNVMVHCYAGISRSASVVIAYIMNKFSWPFQKSIQTVVSRRPQVKPNEGFLKQLISYERTSQQQKVQQRPASQQYRILNAINNVTTRQQQSDTKANKNVDLNEIEHEIQKRQSDLQTLRKKYQDLSSRYNQRANQVTEFRY